MNEDVSVGLPEVVSETPELRALVKDPASKHARGLFSLAQWGPVPDYWPTPRQDDGRRYGWRAFSEDEYDLDAPWARTNCYQPDGAPPPTPVSYFRPVWVGETTAILYVEMDDPSAEEALLVADPIITARTLPALLRLLYEWADAPTDPKNVVPTQVQEAARVTLAALSVPEEVAALVKDAVPPQPVEKYLSGDRNARRRDAFEHKIGDSRSEDAFWWSAISNSRVEQF